MRRAAALALTLIVPLFPATRGVQAGRASSRSWPIEHVVIVFQGNHSFDNVLGRWCAAIDRGEVAHDPCDGATRGTLSDGSSIPLGTASDAVPFVDQGVPKQHAAIDGGRMDGFARLAGCRRNDGYACYTQFDPEQIPSLAALSERFAISDRTFEFRPVSSWAAHLALVAATLDGFRGDTPHPAQPGQEDTGWGCDAGADSRWWDGSSYILVPSCIPDRAGNGPYRASPVRFVPTILDRLDHAGRTWKIYGGTGGAGDAASGYQWTVCPSFYRCLGSPERNHLVPADQVTIDAGAGTLPGYALVTPVAANSQHNGYSMRAGDDWIGRVVAAIMKGPDWPSTAVFILYDNCGCFYDHVPPPNRNAGIRVPLTIVSPYARPGFTDSTDATLASLLAFTERTLGLEPLRSADRNAYDYSDAFDLEQAPLPPIPLPVSGPP